MNFEQAKSELMQNRAHAPAGAQNMPIPQIPSFLLPVVQQFITQYGPGIVMVIEQAAVAGIDALADKLGLKDGTK